MFKRIAIFGNGSAGKRHIKIIKELYPETEIFIYRYNWNEVDEFQPEAAVICNPSHLHYSTALLCAMRGMALFIEKPLLTEINACIELKKYARQIMIGYQFNFAECLQGIQGNRLKICCKTNYKRWRSQPNSYSENLKTGGGAILELSHDILIAYKFVGGKIENNYFNCKKDEKIDYAWEIYLSGSDKQVLIEIDITSDVESRYAVSEKGGYIFYGDELENCYIKQIEAFFNGFSDNLDYYIDFNNFILGKRTEEFNNWAKACYTPLSYPEVHEKVHILRD